MKYPAVIAALIVGMVAGAGGALWARNLVDVVPADQADAPVLLPVRDEEITDRQPAKLALGWTTPRQLAAPHLAGMVTAVAVGPGDELTAGDPVVEVDGISRLAFVADRPLWRDLHRGLEGPDVQTVGSFLRRLGHLDGDPPDTVDRRFQSAVRSFEESLGLPKTGVFSPGYVIWLPEQPFVVGEVLVRAGDVLSGGTPLLTASPRLLEAVLASISPDTPLELPEVPLVFVAADGRQYRVADGTDELAPGEQTHLAEALVSGREELPPEIRGVVERQVPVLVQAVPASAVVVGAGGSQCVIVANQDTLTTRLVDVVGGRPGTARIEPALAPGTLVVANPQILSVTARQCD